MVNRICRSHHAECREKSRKDVAQPLIGHVPPGVFCDNVVMALIYVQKNDLKLMRDSEDSMY